jgi:hypothetical protein
MRRQPGWWIGLIASVLVAVGGQAELIGEPWRHWLTVSAIIATAINGYMLHPQPPAWNGTDRRVSDATLSNLQKGEGV